MRGSPRIWFATSNRHKFEEARLVLKEFGITPGRLPSKGQEIQSDDPEEIANHSCRDAYRAFRRPLFVEDTGFFIESFGGFPGTYASYAFRTLGLEGTLKLLDGSSSRRAKFVGVVAYCDGPSEPRTFKGSLEGRVSLRPSGNGGFGFDPIFVPKGQSRTLAEMSPAEKCQVSHRASALRAFARWHLKARGR